MLRVAFARVRPDMEARLRAWLEELGRRRDEVIESYAREAVRHEQAFIVPGDRGLMLVYVVEAEDIGRAAAAYKASTLRIDADHRAVLKECLLERLEVKPLFDCALGLGRNSDAG